MGFFMASPVFSIVIPTRQRHDTLKYAMQTVLDQTYQDFELIIMDNNSTDETRLVVESFQDNRIHYHYSQERLTMSENWEKGLSFAEGEFIFFLGDDDGLLPDALSVASKILQNSNVPILAWDRNTCNYWWESSILENSRNMLFIMLIEPWIIAMNSKQILGDVYRYKSSYHALPMIYSAFVHRDLIFEIMLVHGRYFCNHIPDVYSGIVNAYFSDAYLFSLRPLSISGISGHSTGVSSSFPHISDRANSTYLEEIKSRGYRLDNHPVLLTDYQCLVIQLADTLLKTKDLFFKDDDGLQLDMKNFLIHLSCSFGINPDAFEQEKLLILELADKYGIPKDEIPLPEKKLLSSGRTKGVFFGDGSPIQIQIDCRVLGISNVSEATKLAYSLLRDIED